MKITGILIFILINCYDSAFSARILAVFPIGAKSHNILFNAILGTLAERGHDVVCYSPLPADNTTKYTVVQLRDMDDMDKVVTKEYFESMINMSPIAASRMMWEKATRLFIDKLVEQELFHELIRSDQKFDLVILQAFIAQEILLALGHRFKAPVISLQPFGAFSIISRTAGNPLNLAYIPDFSFPYSDKMSFYERGLSAYSILLSLYTYYNTYIPGADLHMRNVFKDPTLPPLLDLMSNVSLFINNAHPYVHYSQPYTPNILPVGGIHLEKEKKPLPSEIKKFLDEASSGAIYFSLGSIVPDHMMEKDFFENFIEVFRNVPQKVLWKTRRNFQNLPSNVMTLKWAPQQDILAHPNIKVFMTHGGLFSQHEAIYAGVPVVCIPLYGDQPLNAKFYEEKGVGVRLFFKTLSKETIFSALNTVLSNPQYKENMERLSKIFRDRPQSPAESLVFWVEYVLRHGGAPHLRPAAATMPWYQLVLLDVLAALFGVLTLVLVVSYMIIKRIINLFVKRVDQYSRVGNGKKND